MNFFKKIFFCSGIIYFYFLLKVGKLVSSESEFFILKKFVKKNQNVIDVGANIGRYSFKLSDIIGKNGLVYSFEPMSKSYLTFLTLITFQDIKNILPFNLALSSKSNFVKMKEIQTSGAKYLFDTKTESKIVKNKKNSVIKYSIKLDDLKIKKKISFIKIDCEGFELAVLKGAENTIKINKPVLLVENNDNKINSFLNSLNYKEIISKKKSRNKIFAHKKKYDFKNII
jgi:FkbM family methyltransferase